MSVIFTVAHSNLVIIQEFVVVSFMMMSRGISNAFEEQVWLSFKLQIML